jgi:hypothetical protein
LLVVAVQVVLLWAVVAVQVDIYIPLRSVLPQVRSTRSQLVQVALIALQLLVEMAVTLLSINHLSQLVEVAVELQQATPM